MTAEKKKNKVRKKQQINTLDIPVQRQPYSQGNTGSQEAKKDI